MGNSYPQKKQECEDISSYSSFETPRVRYTNAGFSNLIASRIQTANDGDYRVFLCGDMNGWNRVVPRDKYNGERKLDATISKGGFVRHESISAWVNKIVAYGYSNEENTDDRMMPTNEKSWAFGDRLPQAHRRINNHNNNTHISTSNNNNSSVESSISSNASSCLEGHRNRGNVFYSMYNHSNPKNELTKNDHHLCNRDRMKQSNVKVSDLRASDYTVFGVTAETGSDSFMSKYWIRTRRYNGAVHNRIYRSRRLPNRDVHHTKYLDREKYRGF